MCNEPFKFIPGVYKTRDGKREIEIFAERNGKLFGMFVDTTISVVYWADGRYSNARSDTELDLTPPKPPVVVDDDVLKEFDTAYYYCAHRRPYGVVERRLALAAAITRYLEKNQ